MPVQSLYPVLRMKEGLLAGKASTKKSKQKGGRWTKLLSSQKGTTLPSAYWEVEEPIVSEFQENSPNG